MYPLDPFIWYMTCVKFPSMLPILLRCHGSSYRFAVTGMGPQLLKTAMNEMMEREVFEWIEKAERQLCRYILAL